MIASSNNWLEGAAVQQLEKTALLPGMRAAVGLPDLHPGECGWLKDKFGLCWQIVPARPPELIKTAKGMKAMMSMVKFDIAALERAVSGPA